MNNLEKVGLGLFAVLTGAVIWNCWKSKEDGIQVEKREDPSMIIYLSDAASYICQKYRAREIKVEDFERCLEHYTNAFNLTNTVDFAIPKHRVENNVGRSKTLSKLHLALDGGTSVSVFL